MYNELLKDRPECAEKVESSITFKQDLIEANGGDIENLLEIITEFVNQNYTSKK